MKVERKERKNVERSNSENQAKIRKGRRGSCNRSIVR